MIYNQEFNFLFVHIQKTAGTSITQSLMQCPGSQFVEPAHLRLADVTFPRSKPQVIAVVRNPWERLASWWFMMQRKGVHNDFSAYLLAPLPDGAPVDFASFIRRIDVIEETQDPFAGHVSKGVRKKWLRPYRKSIGWNQEDYLLRKGRFAADVVLRFEDLESEWGNVMASVLGPNFPALAYSNQSSRQDRLNWRSLYEDGRDVDFVSQQFARDLARWGFRFTGSR